MADTQLLSLMLLSNFIGLIHKTAGYNPGCFAFNTFCMKYAVMFFSLVFLLMACQHKAFVAVSAVTHDTTIGCDTTIVSYFKDVKPILSANCYSCHGTGQTQGGGLDLEDFTSLKAYLNNGFRGDGVYGSKLYNCILHSPLAQQMPPTYILDTCSIRKIKRWIDLGGNNN